MAEILVPVLFAAGYLAIAFEQALKIDKAAVALVMGVGIWTVIALGGPENTAGVSTGLGHHLSEISGILFFLLGAMTIVELIDGHDGFSLITNRITTTRKSTLLWLVGGISFFLSAVLDNLTTTIVMVSMLRKLLAEPRDRWYFAGIIVIAANAGGAWSPIGDVTTTMLWIGGHITATAVAGQLILPSLICLALPLAVLTFTKRGRVQRPVVDREAGAPQVSPTEKGVVLVSGILSLLFVPVFKTITHLPPYMGILLSLGALWIVTELLHWGKARQEKEGFSVVTVIRRIDTPGILFFLGILLAVAGLQQTGQLASAASGIRSSLDSVELITLSVGLLSAIVDNVPLVAAAMGMYPLQVSPADPWSLAFVADGRFWMMLAYCAGTGGSVLIIGSAAGIAAMGLEKITFGWYLKNISALALLGYLGGAVTYLLMHR